MTEFAADLYHGTAEFYDRFRLPYPAVLIDDLVGRVQPSGRGWLLDLACGTGQLAFALQDHFAEVWAVDHEPDMIRMVQAKGAVHAIASSAETLSAAPTSFELITIGNAFHRLDRDQVARRALGWLHPGGYLALCWSSSPWAGDRAWQLALNELLDEWRAELGADDRVPPGWDKVRPHRDVLIAAGFESVSRYQFTVERQWTVGDLAGLVYSTSFLPAPLLGARAAEFEGDLADRLGPHGTLADDLSFAYDLARKPC
jgi:SAM-dependent methyltransferase